MGYGGVIAVSRATGIAQNTIKNGIQQLESNATQLPTGKQRAAGGGRKNLKDKDPHLQAELDKLIEPYTSGDPMRPLRWTCKSTSKLAVELN